jgi:hypothetical protein
MSKCLSPRRTSRAGIPGGREESVGGDWEITDLLRAQTGEEICVDIDNCRAEKSAAVRKAWAYMMDV